MGKVYKAKKRTVKDNTASKVVTPNSPVRDESMEQLARIMNDTPSIVKLRNTKWEITGLKPAVQMLIAEEACKIVNGEKMSMGDVIKEFSLNLSVVAKCLAFAMLNNKNRIYKDYASKTYSDEYSNLVDTLMWGEYDMRDWGQLLYEVLSLINTDFFFQTIGVIKTVREMTLMRKTTKAEAG